MSYKYADLFLQDSVKKELNIVFDNGTIANAELHSNQFELNESICSENELRFGCCEASSVKFKASNVFESLNGKEIDISMILNGHSDEPFKFGKYKVVSDTPTADRNFRDIVAYDKMHDIINSDVAEWYNSLNFPLTMKSFRNSFISYFGIEEVETVLVNDEMLIGKTVETVELSGKDVVRAICELNGCFGHINREDKFEYIFLSNDITTISNNHYISCQYEDFKTQYIDELEIRPEEDSAGSIVGDSKGNVYIIYGNFLLYGKTTDELTEIAEKLLPVIEVVQYRPASVSAIGNPTVSVGDGIQLNTKYEIINTYVLQRKITGIQSLKDSYISTGVEKYTGNVNSIKNDILKLKAKTNILKRTAEETKSTIEDLEKDLKTEIAQTASEVKIEVQKNIDKIQIGGRNLALISDEEKTGVNTILQYDISDYGLNNIFNGQVVTISFEAKADVDNTIIDTYVRGKNISSGNGVSIPNGGVDITVLSNKYVRYSATMTLTYDESTVSTDDATVAIRNSSNASESNDGTVNVYVRNVKIEIGNKATDWTPAPEDIDNRVDEVERSMNEAIVDQATSIRSDAEKIILSALESYVTTGDYEAYKSTIQTQLAIMANEIIISFESATSQINDVNSDAQSKFNEFYKHISFTGDNGIEIHDGANTLSLIMDTDGISFRKNGEQFGFWDGNDFYTGNIVVQLNERAQFGNYAFVPRSDGSLMFLKVGD